MEPHAAAGAGQGGWDSAVPTGLRPGQDRAEAAGRAPGPAWPSISLEDGTGRADTAAAAAGSGNSTHAPRGCSRGPPGQRDGTDPGSGNTHVVAPLVLAAPWHTHTRTAKLEGTALTRTSVDPRLDRRVQHPRVALAKGALAPEPQSVLAGPSCGEAAAPPMIWRNRRGSVDLVGSSPDMLGNLAEQGPRRIYWGIRRNRKGPVDLVGLDASGDTSSHVSVLP